MAGPDVAENLANHVVCCGACFGAGRIGTENVRFPVVNLKNLKNLKSQHKSHISFKAANPPP